MIFVVEVVGTMDDVLLEDVKSVAVFEIKKTCFDWPTASDIIVVDTKSHDWGMIHGYQASSRSVRQSSFIYEL